jgi:hypothetical protein
MDFCQQACGLLNIGINMGTAFFAHGKTEIIIEGNIIIIQCVGPWNIEYFHGLHQDIVSAVSQVNINNYAVLLKPIGEAICVAEAIDYHVAFLNQGNAKAIAVNLSDSDVPNTTKSLCNKAYEKAQLNFQFFYSDEPAKVWLKESLS